MKSIYQFIVEPVNKKRYNNTKTIAGIEFIVSTSEEDVSASNREAIVIETPLNYDGPIEKGDVLLVHHNVFKFYNDMRGRRQSGKSFFKENIFFLDKATTNEPLIGTIAIINEELKSQGLKEGDVVCYKPSQEYEFKVDDEVLWRMYDHSITLQL